MRRHAEIAGGGIGGLSSALMLTQQGWTVRVHERSPSIREVGAGIYIKNNALEVFEAIGLLDELAPHGFRLERGQYLDRNGHLIQDRPFTGKARVQVFLRQTLVEILRDAAERAGAEIVTGSTAIAAEPSGELLLEDGRRLRADLVVAADGVRSRVRDTLDLGASYRSLPTIVTRYLVPSREITPDPVTREHWSGRYRIGITPCRHDLSYIYQVCPASDEPAAALPADVEFWSRAFPKLGPALELISQGEPDRRNYSVVRCPRWQRGRVAIIGDAAHGLPPTLGQGVGLTLMNAYALCIALGHDAEVDTALPIWEAAVRFISDRTQRWADRYDLFTRQWPAPLWFMHPAIIWAFRSIPAVNQRMRIADRGLPVRTLAALAGGPDRPLA